MWVGSARNARPEDDKREKLLAKRVLLVTELEELVAAQKLKPPSRAAASAHWDAEDRKELASKIVAIDKKLGR